MGHPRRIAMLLILLYLITPQAYGGWSIGVPGVISVGSGGVKAGKDAQGVDVKLPNCGGSICGGAEHLKNEVNGENERKKQEADARNAQIELNKVRRQVNETHQQIVDVERQLADTRSAYAAAKSTISITALDINTLAQTFTNQHLTVQSTLAKALERIKEIRRKGTQLNTQSADSLKRLENLIAEMPVENNESTSLARAKGVALNAMTPDLIRALNVRETELKNAISSYLLAEEQFNLTAKNSKDFMAQLSNDFFANGFFSLLTSLEDGLTQQKPALEGLAQSTDAIAQNAQQISEKMGK